MDSEKQCDTVQICYGMANILQNTQNMNPIVVWGSYIMIMQYYAIPYHVTIGPE